MPAFKAIVDGSAFMGPYSQISPRNKEFMAALAETALQLIGDFYLVAHRYFSREPDVPVRERFIFAEHFLSLPKEDSNSFSCNPLELFRLLVFSSH